MVHTRVKRLAHLVEKENATLCGSEHLPCLLWRLPNDSRHKSGSRAVIYFELVRWYYAKPVQQPCDNFCNCRLARARIAQE